MLDVAIPVGAFLALRRDCIDIGCVQRGGLGDAGAPGLLIQPLEQVGRASTALVVGNCAERGGPLVRVDGFKILHAFHLVLPLAFPPLLVGPGLAGSVPRSWLSSNAPIALQLQAFFVHHVLPVHLFVQKFGMTTCVMSGNPNRWAAAGVPLRPDYRTTR